jgi:hypothetical protein
MNNLVTSGCSLFSGFDNQVDHMMEYILNSISPDWMDLVIESVDEAKVKKPRKRSNYRRMKELPHATVKGLGRAGRALRGIV